MQPDLSLIENPLSLFKGNLLGPEEREYRLRTMPRDDCDPEFLPYLDRINAFPFLITTQHCSGHGEKGLGSRRAHLDFRSMLPERMTINLLLRPMEDKYPHDISIQLFTECARLRYCLWLDNERWEEQILYFISLLYQIPVGIEKCPSTYR